MLISQENTACHLARPSPRSALASVSIATQRPRRPVLTASPSQLKVTTAVIAEAPAQSP